jgi:hypothetical protein
LISSDIRRVFSGGTAATVFHRKTFTSQQLYTPALESHPGLGERLANLLGVSMIPRKAWYGVRTLYRLAAEGAPKIRDRHFDPESTLIEDRVVLFQATNFDEAIAQGIREGQAYCKQAKFVNPYGQKVRMRFLEACDAFEIFEGRLGAGLEVYSSTELVRASISDQAVIRRRMGPKAAEPHEARYKFVNARIVRKALTHAALIKDNAEEH